MGNLDYGEISALFAANGAALSRSQFDSFCAYADMIEAENRRQNLTAVSGIREIFERHFLDSAVLLPEIHGRRGIDIGTGAGLPGIALMILNPELRVTLLDSEQRKVDFCAAVLRQLRLDGEAVCARAEELSRDAGYREQYDFAVSRAVAKGNVLCELAVPFLRVGGELLALKGRGFDDETERFAPAAKTLLCEPPEFTRYILLGEEKTLVTILKFAPTPEPYPRRFAKIKRAGL